MLQMLAIHTAAEHGVNTAPPATPLTNTKLEQLHQPSFDLDNVPVRVAVHSVPVESLHLPVTGQRGSQGPAAEGSM